MKGEIVWHQGKPFRDHLFNGPRRWFVWGNNEPRSTPFGDALKDKETQDRISKIFADQIDKLAKDMFTRGMT